jgi:hypothetical protein
MGMSALRERDAHGMINTKGCNYWARFVVEYGRENWDEER